MPGSGASGYTKLGAETSNWSSTASRLNTSRSIQKRQSNQGSLKSFSGTETSRGPCCSRYLVGVSPSWPPSSSCSSSSCWPTSYTRPWPRRRWGALGMGWYSFKKSLLKSKWMNQQKCVFLKILKNCSVMPVFYLTNIYPWLQSEQEDAAPHLHPEVSPGDHSDDGGPWWWHPGVTWLICWSS